MWGHVGPIKELCKAIQGLLTGFSQQRPEIAKQDNTLSKLSCEALRQLINTVINQSANVSTLQYYMFYWFLFGFTGFSGCFVCFL